MSMKHLVRTLGLALVAVLAVSAAAVASASAAEGPFYKIEGLEPTMSQGITAEQNGNQVLTASTVTITCKKVGLETGAIIVPHGKTTGGTSEETLKYTECTQTGDGTRCEVENKEVKTNLLENVAGYETSSRTGKILVGFKPKSGSTFAVLKFTGTCNDGTSNAVEVAFGDQLGVICRTLNETGVLDEVGKESESKKNELECPTPAISTLNYEKAGTLETLKAGLRVVGIAVAEYVGNSFVSLTSGKTWGLFTK